MNIYVAQEPQPYFQRLPKTIVTATSIQEALAMALAGDKVANILIAGPGRYEEELHIPEGLVSATIVCEGDLRHKHMILITKPLRFDSPTTLRGLDVKVRQKDRPVTLLDPDEAGKCWRESVVIACEFNWLPFTEYVRPGVYC